MSKFKEYHMCCDCCGKRESHLHEKSKNWSTLITHIFLNEITNQPEKRKEHDLCSKCTKKYMNNEIEIR